MTFEYLENYKYKIKSVSELLESIGTFPRSTTVILCHGVFDVVHPGHLRHLSYAKSRANVLVVSLTADRHIKKGTYRPHVPENIRALNLAALEMVDYVIIDDSATPIENIKKLQPDFFAKGFEYSGSSLPLATLEESAAVSAYGGKTIFTPGDLVLSSSSLIEQKAPNLMIEKIISIMQTHKFTFADITNALDQFDGINVHVIGDTIVDTYTETSMIGGQTKTPTISVRFLDSKSYVGGAGVVALHLQSAGANVTFTTLLGQDSLAQMVCKDLQSSGITINRISDNQRPTTEKNAIICNGYRLLKLDTLDNTPISTAVTNEFMNSISSTESDIIVFSDFRHGIFHKQNIPDLISAINEEVFKVADSQVASRWGNVSDFIGFDLITPNEREARFSLADQDSTIGPLAGNLYRLAKCKNLILKLGEKGLIGLSSYEIENDPIMISLNSFTENPIDPVGAGDALMAYAALTLKVTGSLPMAAIIGSIAAACESDLNGNIPIKRNQIIEKLDSLKKSMGYEVQ